jgi:hypothetical protein
LRENLKQVEKATGMKPKELEGIYELPWWAEYLWNGFLRLNLRRPFQIVSTMETAKQVYSPISYSELYAFNKLQIVPFNTQEIQIIEEMDTLYVSIINKN